MAQETRRHFLNRAAGLRRAGLAYTMMPNGLIVPEPSPESLWHATTGPNPQAITFAALAVAVPKALEAIKGAWDLAQSLFSLGKASEFDQLFDRIKGLIDEL